ncbi:MAG TPA: biopolymer transporter Tol [Gemmataceae bacterium]|nr:biopolymer transporter Tol [Gemmataceae bacterium]
MWTVCACLFLAAQPGADWQKEEAVHLKNIKQVTHDYIRAGEGYFSPDGSKIIFQAEEKGENPFYQMFVMDLKTGAARRVSPGVGKTTCGFFHPKLDKIIFASSHLDPDAKKHYEPEFKARAEEKASKKRRRYVWDFDPYMEIFESNLDGSFLVRLTKSKGYDAEGSYSPDGKQIVFCSNRSGEKNLELYIMNADGSDVRQLTHAPGCYNGGPFFSPDGKKVIFRSDRKKKDHLQLYVINADGTGEKALTDDENWVFWAPYWYKDGKHIIYTAADHSNPLARPNYDLYWMNIDTLKKVRLTFAPGADVLPVFSPDYAKVMWTSNRDGRSPTQLYIADFTAPKQK